jgi:hypothetical protein
MLEQKELAEKLEQLDASFDDLDIPSTEDYKTFNLADATKEDFNTTVPYEYLYSLRKDRFIHDVMRDAMADAAKINGIQNFKKRYENYVTDIRFQSAKPVGSVTDFQDQPMELATGKWQASEGGVYCEGEKQTLEACNHPIMPVERLINVDTGMEKMKIAFKTGHRWREYMADKSILASAQAIIALADYGISVTSETAKNLVRYFQDIEHLNYDLIPEKRSVGRLGWISDHGFSPYVDNLIFDGEHNYRTVFDAVRTQGSYNEWHKIASDVRRGSTAARIVLSASFASALVEPCGCLPFFVHLWGAESGSGKTVALMAAASVWACPAIGQYIQTFNSTSVSKERTAALCNSLPLMIDELQLNGNGAKNKSFDPYQLAEGVGRGRGTKYGGIERTSRWANCIITTGEAPLVSMYAGAGAINRVLDIECSADKPVILDGHRIANAVKKHYGHAGKIFIDEVIKMGPAAIQEEYQRLFAELSIGDTTEKQAMAAAMIVLADQLASAWIFADDMNITTDEIREFMASKAEVSSMQRGYNYLMDWIAQNGNKFKTDVLADRYGDVNFNTVFVIKSIFDQALEEAGFSSKALLSWMDRQGLIGKQDNRFTTVRRIGDHTARCVAIRNPVGMEEVLDV